LTFAADSEGVFDLLLVVVKAKGEEDLVLALCREIFQLALMNPINGHLQRKA
jgi:hypothetical protein